MASHGLKTLFYIFKDSKGTFLGLLRTSLPTAKKVRYLFVSFMRSLEIGKKGTSFAL